MVGFGREWKMEDGKPSALKSKTGVPAARELVVRWYQVKNCNSCSQ